VQPKHLLLNASKHNGYVPPALTLKHHFFLTQWICVFAYDFQSKQAYLPKQHQAVRLSNGDTVCFLGILKYYLEEINDSKI
jgi:hypothetical protein